MLLCLGRANHLPGGLKGERKPCLRKTQDLHVTGFNEVLAAMLRFRHSVNDTKWYWGHWYTITDSKKVTVQYFLTSIMGKALVSI